MTLMAPPSSAVRLVHDPQPGLTVTVVPGQRLALRFRCRGLGLSRWEVLDRPDFLLPLEEGPHGFLFLVFDQGGEEDAGRPLRLVRRRVDRSGPGEVRDVVVRLR